MEIDPLDNIIELLNKQGLPEHHFKKQSTHITKESDVNSEKQGKQQSDPMEIFDFNQIYSKRFEKMEKKNATKMIELNKKKQLAEKMIKKYPQPKLIIQANEVIKLPSIRYLIFKNWSGSHLNYEICDNGYKFRFTNGVASLIKHLLQQNGFCEATNQEGLIIWNIGVIQPSTYQSLGAYQKINHFPKSFEITRKDLMLQNLSKMKFKHANHYNFYPQTFILPQECSQFMDHAEKQKNSDKWYIVKPSNKSQGKGIWLSNKPEEILAKQKQCVVVSEYVHNPLLVNGLKFDMRIYVAITCFNPLRIYIYEDGLTRFATSEYSSDLTTKENLFAHLTNYSLNKFSQNFVANDDEDQCKGHKWSLHALKEYMNQNGYDVQTIWGRIEDLLIKSIISIENTVFNAMEMQVPYRTNCFEVLGFDVLLDENLRPWLLEINLSPSLNTDSSLDLKIKGSMIADLFTMIGIVSIDQQFSVDKSHLLNLNRMSQKQMKNQYSKLQRLVLKESEEEEKRSAGWRKIFPTETAARYKPFFDVDRPLNRLLRDEELKKMRKNTNVNYNLAMKTINENPQMEKKKKE